jgi:hypothetical protein
MASRHAQGRWLGHRDLRSSSFDAERAASRLRTSLDGQLQRHLEARSSR